MASTPSAVSLRSGTGRESTLRRLDALAVSAAGRPYATLGVLLSLNMVLVPLFVGAGFLVGDRAAFLREAAPGTWLSFAELLFVAVAARAVALRDASRFWGLCALVFLVFAIDEITQAGMFLSELLESRFDLAPASGFNDLDSVLLTGLFVACGLLLATRARVLLAHPRTLALLVAGATLGATSQALDSFAPATAWEFVAEESLKLSAEPFFVAAFLVALASVLRRDGPGRRGAPAT